MDTTRKVYFPKWSATLYGVLAVILIPWIFDLAYSLPSRHIDTHWDAVWVGFDIMMLTSLALTIWFAINKRVWVVISATALATFFIVDAWFDILTARPGHEQRIALFFGVIEITLAILTYRLVYRVIHHTTPEKHVKLVAHSKR